MENKNNLYTVTAYAELMGVNRRSIYNWINAGTNDFEFVLVGGRRLIRPLSFDEIRIKKNTFALSNFNLAELSSLANYITANPSVESLALLPNIKNEIDSRIKKLL